MRGLIAVIAALAVPASVSAHVRVTLLEHHAAAPAQITTLIAPDGRPVGGQWQQWMNESEVPTYRGAMILDTNPREVHDVCNAEGCSAPTGPCVYRACGAGHPETWLAIDTRVALYYEHGHIIDFTMATDVDRAAFMRIWRLPGTIADWWHGEALFTTQGAYPPGELWSTAYALCAKGSSDLKSIDAAQGRTLNQWAVDAQRQTCALFRHL